MANHRPPGEASSRQTIPAWDQRPEVCARIVWSDGVEEEVRGAAHAWDSRSVLVEWYRGRRGHDFAWLWAADVRRALLDEAGEPPVRNPADSA